MAYPSYSSIKRQIRKAFDNEIISWQVVKQYLDEVEGATVRVVRVIVPMHSNYDIAEYSQNLRKIIYIDWERAPDSYYVPRGFTTYYIRIMSRD